MKYFNLEQFFRLYLRTKQHWKKKTISMQDAIWQILDNDIWLNGCEYAKGSRFKVFETSNFGWIVFGPDTKTPKGDTPSRRIIKY